MPEPPKSFRECISQAREASGIETESPNDITTYAKFGAICLKNTVALGRKKTLDYFRDPEYPKRKPGFVLAGSLALSFLSLQSSEGNILFDLGLSAIVGGSSYAMLKDHNRNREEFKSEMLGGPLAGGIDFAILSYAHRPLWVAAAVGLVSGSYLASKAVRKINNR
jgi:hypothetical protein